MGMESQLGTRKNNKIEKKCCIFKLLLIDLRMTGNDSNGCIRAINALAKNSRICLEMAESVSEIDRKWITIDRNGLARKCLLNTSVMCRVM